jgi:ethanolamine utilization protein EutN
MKIARVIGTVVSTVKHESHDGLKMLLCRPEDLSGNPEGPAVIAADLVQAGVGDRVLLMTDGSSSRTLLNNEGAAVRLTVCAIVDHVDL